MYSFGYARCVRKEPDWLYENCIIITITALKAVTFKVISWQSCALLHSFLPTFNSFLKGHIGNTSELHRCGPFITSMSSQRVPFMTPLSLGNKEKLHDAKSGEEGGWSWVTVFFLARNSGILRAVWAGALSCCSSQEFWSQRSLHLSQIDQRSHCRISLYTCWWTVVPWGKNSKRQKRLLIAPWF